MLPVCLQRKSLVSAILELFLKRPLPLSAPRLRTRLLQALPSRLPPLRVQMSLERSSPVLLLAKCLLGRCLMLLNFKDPAVGWRSSSRRRQSQLRLSRSRPRGFSLVHQQPLSLFKSQLRPMLAQCLPLMCQKQTRLAQQKSFQPNERSCSSRCQSLAHRRCCLPTLCSLRRRCRSPSRPQRSANRSAAFLPLLPSWICLPTSTHPSLTWT